VPGGSTYGGMDMLLNVAGWLGGLLVIVAYGLLSLRWVNSDGFLFNILNTVGGALLVGTAIQAGAVPNAAINVVWVVFGLYALATRYRSGGRPQSRVGRGDFDHLSVDSRSGSLESVAGRDVVGDG
jgi:hypothetical protein